MDNLNITRFSYQGFEAQCQNNYIKENCIRKDDNYNLAFDNGVWVFIRGREDKYLLNHLDYDEIPYLDCWEAEIPINTMVLKHEEPYKLSSISTVKEEVNEDAFFIPEKSLKELKNIRQTYNRFA